MDRRAFLRRFGLGAAAVVTTAVLDPERMLWVPGQKTVFLPPVTRFKPNNTFLTVDIITREALRALENNLQMLQILERPYDSQFGGTVIGDHVTIRTTQLFR